MRFITIPRILRSFYPSLVWEMPRDEKKIFLTFDDGPHPIITPKIIDLLRRYDAKATFFCVGRNVEANKDIFNMILKEGHSVGNHTYNHDRGWRTATKDYIESVERANEHINSNLFRPPHGRIKYSQIRALQQKYKIITWTVISYDWDKSITSDDCFNNIIRNADSGSIIVFHDSEKAINNMLPALEKVLKYYKSKGFTFEKI